MSEKVITVSARVSRKHSDIVDRLTEEMGLSKTDVLQTAIEMLGSREGISKRNRVTLEISGDSLRRAGELHWEWDQKTSVDEVLVAALEIGIEAMEDAVTERRKKDRERDLAHIEAQQLRLELKTTSEK